MNEQKTFRNLMVLQAAREGTMAILKSDYYGVVEPYKKLIYQVAEANNENHFDAMGRILKYTDLAKGEQKLLIFSSALMEIVIEKDLKDFEE